MKCKSKKNCCCKCNLFSPVQCHPLNEKNGKGKLSEIFGYVCAAFKTQGSNHLVFFEKCHGGGCECFAKKTK